jgi:hypothetical protein
MAITEDSIMGDRAMAQIKVGEKSLYFYTHWAGSELPAAAEKAVKAAMPRKGDDSYALKIVIDTLINETGTRDKETGGGLMFEPYAEDEYNKNKPSVIIDIKEMSVRVER